MRLKLAIAVACLAAAVAFAEREPGGLDQSAPDADLKYEPATDYDNDGCYPTPAIGPSGKQNPAKELGGDVNGKCHDEVDLEDANIYSRSKCNNGWCAYMYAYYFEKDQCADGPSQACGHPNDWEHIVVWVADDSPDDPTWVAVSQHGKWFWQNRDQIQWDRTHAKVVYNKDGAGTHDFRFATGGDEPPENDTGEWHLPKVIGWDNFPPGFRDLLVTDDWGHAKLELKDENFHDALNNSKPSEVPLDPFA